MFVEAADEIDALRGAVRSLAGWVRELDPHPSLDPCEYLTDEAEMAAVRRAFVKWRHAITAARKRRQNRTRTAVSPSRCAGPS